MKPLAIIAILAALAFAMAPAVHAQLIEETFDTAGASATFDAAPVGDWTVDFSFDYSTLTIPATGTPVDNTAIPEAPNTPSGAVATRGLATQVNLTGTATSLSLFTAASVSGDFIAQVDVFYYHDGNSGSTEDAMVGINHSGTFPIAFRQAGQVTAQTDGYFFKTHGDVDVGAEDYFFLEGTNGAITVDPQPGTTWADGQFPDVAGRQYNVPLFLDSAAGYPAGATTPGGAFRWAWDTVRFQYLNNVVSMFINDHLIVTYDDPDNTFTSGKIMLGHEDSFSGANTGNYMIFDNLIVNQITTTGVNDFSLYR
jgi:hypothetical protein